MNNVDQLEDVLRNNPFGKVVDSWRQQALDHRHGTLVEVRALRYLLPEDMGLQQYADDRFFESRLRIEMIPQPFIGDPRADIWYVQINPGFHPIDYYDYCSTDNSVKDYIVRWFVADPRCRGRVATESTDYRFIDDEDNMFQQRCGHLTSQLELSATGSVLPFYPLEPCFRTLQVENRAINTGCNAWWCQALCMGNRNALFRDVFDKQMNPHEQSRELGGRLFVIENFPYHSQRFSRQDYGYAANHPYKHFVTTLLRYAVDNNKQILFRSRAEYNSTCVGLDFDIRANSYLLSNPQRVWLTSNLHRVDD